MVATVAVLGGVFTYFNTNVLTPDRICHGWVTPDEVADALGGGPGRVSESADSDTACTIRKEAWLPGSDDKQLELSAERENSEFPFPEGNWEISGAQHVMAGGTQGSFDTYGGWALLPPSCTTAAFGRSGPRAVLRASITRGDSGGDAAGMGRLLASAAKALPAGSADCAASGYGESPTRSFAPSAGKATDFDEVCGIPGFRLGKVTGPKGEQVRERVSGSLQQGLYCDLSFTGDEEGPFAHLAIVNDPPLVGSFKSRSFARADCGGRETVFADDLRYFDPEERAASGVPDSADLAEAFSKAAHAALHCD